MVTHSSVRAKNCSNISDAGHLTHWDGGKHVFYPPCPFHYQYPALGLHVSWCQCQPADYLLVAGPQPMGGLRPGSGPITWKLDLEQRPELIWITVHWPRQRGRSTGRRQTNSGASPQIMQTRVTEQSLAPCLYVLVS